MTLRFKSVSVGTTRIHARSDWQAASLRAAFSPAGRAYWLGIMKVLRLIVSTFLLLQLTTAMAGPDQAFFLEFMTEQAGSSKHGTLSFIDSSAKSTWTLVDGRSKKTFDVPLSEAKFRKLWDVISATPELERFRVKDPEVRLDFAKNYVIGIVYSFSGRQGQATYVIPHDSTSQQAVRWANEIEAVSEQ